MPTIVFATPKGGAGKTTSAIVLGTELAYRGAAVTMIDADRNKPICDWAALGKPDNITVIAATSEETILDEIDSAAEKTAFVIVDLEGTASVMVAYAISRADLVIIPTQGSRQDGKQAARAVSLVKQQEKAFGKTIPYAILYTKTSSAIRPRTLAHIQDQFQRNNIRAFRTHLHGREAFNALHSFGGSLETLDSLEVSGIDKAILNAREFVAEFVAMLRSEPKAVVNG